MPWLNNMRDLERVISVIHSSYVKASADHQHRVPQLEARVKALGNAQRYSTAGTPLSTQETLHVRKSFNGYRKYGNIILNALL